MTSAGVGVSYRSAYETALALGAARVVTRRHRTGVEQLARPRDAVAVASYLGLRLDPWQERTLGAPHRRKLCLVARQGGKGVVGTLEAIAHLLTHDGAKAIILTPTEEQSKRLLSRIREAYARLPACPSVVTDVATTFRLATGSQVLAMPGSETSVRGIEAVTLLIVDEAALVPDDLYAAVRPVLATTDGRELDLSTPHGTRGWFWESWLRATTPPIPSHLLAVRVEATEIPRISSQFLANERSELGDLVFRQEYLVEWLEDVSSVFSADLIAAAVSAEAISRGLPRLGVA